MPALAIGSLLADAGKVDADEGHLSVGGIVGEVGARSHGLVERLLNEGGDVDVDAVAAVLAVVGVAFVGPHLGHHLVRGLEEAVGLADEVVAHAADGVFFILIALFVEVARHLVDGGFLLEGKVGEVNHDHGDDGCADAAHDAAARLLVEAQTVGRRGYGERGRTGVVERFGMSVVKQTHGVFFTEVERGHIVRFVGSACLGIVSGAGTGHQLVALCEGVAEAAVGLLHEGNAVGGGVQEILPVGLGNHGEGGAVGLGVAADALDGHGGRSPHAERQRKE